MKKFKIEDVRAYIEKGGFKLLSEEYIDSVTPLKIQCPEGHSFFRTFANFKVKGYSCPICSGYRPRKSYEEVKEKFEKYGFTLLTKKEEYKNIKQKLKVVCPEGHKSEVRFSNFSISIETGCTGCKICGINRNKLSFKDIKKFFANEGYTVLSEESEYSNSETPVRVLCPNKHESKMSYHNFRTGARCRYCSKENGFNNIKHDFSYVKKEIESKGFTLLSKESDYSNSKTKLKLKCKEGHIFERSFHMLHKYKDCPECKKIKNRKIKMLSYSVVKERIESEGYELLSKEYEDNHKKLKLRCPRGHICYISLNNFGSGHRCSKCPFTKSRPELEVFNFVAKYFPETISGDRSLIPHAELDIVIPSKKLAIEYCGLYWHSENSGKHKDYHLDKLKKCEKVGYKLITLFDDEWKFKREIVISRLENLLGLKSKKSVSARKCQIKEIDSKIKAEFLKQNHLQGNTNSLINLGLFSDDNLVSVMTFSKTSISKGRKAEDGVYELSRFCSKLGYNARGAASKLLKYFERNYKPDKIISYSDRRWSVGSLYKTLGFEFIHHSPPSYWYIQGGRKRVHRFNFRKSVLNEKLENFDPNKTEVENMNNNGYDRIFDCGNSLWEKTYKGD
jgi:hypothetical protein